MVPVIPPHKPKPSATAEIEAEILRAQARYAQLATEYESIDMAKRRALHELDMASLELKLAVERRIKADAQVEKARAGVLGIDYVPDLNES